MKFTAEERIVFVILFVCFVVMVVLILLSGGFYGGGDSIAHYRISHYAWTYPHLLLDHWGKPVFTIFSSPFSWFGFNGARLYNVVVGLLTAYLTYLVVRQEMRESTWLSIFFVVLAPIYFILFFSAMTEITFSLVLILSVYFIYRKKYNPAALVLSFLPFVRTEGFVIVIVILVSLFWYRQYKSIPFLFTGFVIFSLAGWPYYHDPLWVIHRMPYTGAADIYGHGTLMHFVRSSPRIFGIPLVLFWLAGVASLVRDFFQRVEVRKKALFESWFVLLPFLAYFFAHSYVWWKGLGGSLGLIRVMAGIVPLAAITAMRGYRLVTGVFQGRTIKQYVLPAVTLAVLLIPPLSFHKVPLRPDETECLLTEAAEWVKNSPYADHRIYYYDLYFQFKLRMDPYDQEHCRERVPDPEHPGKEVPTGSIVQWDAHYGPNEGHLPLEKLLDNPDYTLLKIFKPEHPFKVMGGYEYAIYLFLRNDENSSGE